MQSESAKSLPFLRTQLCQTSKGLCWSLYWSILSHPWGQVNRTRSAPPTWSPCPFSPVSIQRLVFLAWSTYLLHNHNKPHISTHISSTTQHRSPHQSIETYKQTWVFVLASLAWSGCAAPFPWSTTTSSPWTLTIGQINSQGRRSGATMIWNPSTSTTASQCDSSTNTAIQHTSAYAGPNHDLCNYPFDFAGNTNLTLSCAQYTTTNSALDGKIHGILTSDGTQAWTCVQAPNPLNTEYDCGNNANIEFEYICQ